MARKNQDPQVRKIYLKAFYFKVLCVFAYTLVTEFYFKGGDTGLYYQAILDLRAAINDDFDHIGHIVGSIKLNSNNPIAPYFLYDHYADDFTYNYMLTPGNFFVPRLGLFPAILFFNSYVCISLIFGFFAMAGALRIFKTFRYYYPTCTKELALATVFLPSVGFWSAGLLKDPVCFGCIGFILYAAHNIFIKKVNYKSSFAWIIICGTLLFYIKVYILLVLILAITVWLFAETNKLIAGKTLRTVFSILTLAVSFLIAYLLLNYFTSQDAAKDYKLETLLQKTEYQRTVIQNLVATGPLGSNFSINTSNVVVLIFNSIVATFFRPFLWEITTPIALFSAFESAIFLFLTINFFLKRGIVTYFRFTFADPRMLMCFIFSIIFAIAIGASTSNFGTLSRYKIPSMPFYFIMLLLFYRKASLAYPKWFNKILNRIN